VSGVPYVWHAAETAGAFQLQASWGTCTHAGALNTIRCSCIRIRDMLATTYNIQQEYIDFPVHCNNYMRKD